MKIALINGSPKNKGSVSETILQAMCERLGDAHDYVTCSVAAFDKAQVLSSLQSCGAILFAFPLYVDGIPSRLLQFLDEIKDEILTFAPDAMVWAIANNGFYEGRQNALALAMIQNFCHSSGLPWGQGIGVGAGGMAQAAPAGTGPMKNMGLALDALAENICHSRCAENQFVLPNFPRFLYKAGGNYGWKAEARKNGLRIKNILKKQV